MRRLQLIAIVISLATATACGGSQSADPVAGGTESANGSGSTGGEASPQGGGQTRDDEFQLQNSDTAGQAHGDRPSEIEASRTHAAMRLFVVDPDAGPIEGIVIKLTAPDHTAYYTGETDSLGYGEVLVPVGQRYEIEYLSLGRQTTSATVEVAPGPNQDIRLTMRHRRHRRRARPTPPATPQQAEAQPTEAAPEPEAFVLDGVLFETGSATIAAESHGRLDRVVEYMTHRASTRIGISGHTDNVGNARRNQALSEARAQSVREYIVSHGIDGGRVEAIGFGDQQPVASNDTETGRQQNRRIEAILL